MKNSIDFDSVCYTVDRIQWLNWSHRTSAATSSLFNVFCLSSTKVYLEEDFFRVAKCRLDKKLENIGTAWDVDIFVNSRVESNWIQLHISSDEHHQSHRVRFFIPLTLKWSWNLLEENIIEILSCPIAAALDSFDGKSSWAIPSCYFLLLR